MLCYETRDKILNKRREIAELDAQIIGGVVEIVAEESAGIPITAIRPNLRSIWQNRTIFLIFYVKLVVPVHIHNLVRLTWPELAKGRHHSRHMIINHITGFNYTSR